MKYPGGDFPERALNYLELSKYSPLKKKPVKHVSDIDRIVDQYRSNLKALINAFPRNTAAIEYYDTYQYDYSESTYAAVISNKRVKLLRVNFSNREAEMLQGFLDNMGSVRLEEYKKYSYLLYEKFVANLNLDPTINRLIIIPGVTFTHQIPFSAITYTKHGNDFKSLDYLLKKYTISWSLGLVHDRTILRSENEENNVAYVSPENKQFSKLPFSQMLIARLASEYPGRVLEGDNVNSAILNQFRNFKIIHLATHAVANEREADSSFLVFSDRNVYTPELYNLRLDAALVNLSACETVRGVSSPHNGSVMNFVRAFTYAGARSVTSTLWKVDDQMSAQIYGDFFDRLAKGETKDISLRGAKLDYLKACSEETAHPYYWAGIVLYGDTDTIELKKTSDKQPLIVISVAIAAIIVIYLTLKKKLF